MKVRFEPLPWSSLVKLVALEQDPVSGIEAGEVLAYRCVHCENADETAMQVVHAEGCPEADDRERSELERGFGTRTAELSPEHPITIVRMGETNKPRGLFDGVPVAFRCDECGASDETLSEIVHDTSCSLATEEETGNEILRRVRVDG